ncbi:septum formation family protein [Dactylosporangium sp. NPDC051484]|uniref:septum formation family protein n=1 Tax=Dactylosporangium sp. NPDC051484 TaxID=3154942 RepID=UPI00344F3B6C
MLATVLISIAERLRAVRGGWTTMMRAARLWTAAVFGGVLLAATACQAPPPGTDGDLVDDWPALAAPVFDVPAVGTCLDSTARKRFDPRFYRATPIACDQLHALEVVLIGTVQGNAADASAPPEAGSEAFQAAYTACGKAAGDYVGGDWHDGLLGIEVQLPTSTPWKAGKRTYVCSIYGTSSAYGDMAFRTGSLKGALAGSAPSALRCLEVVGDAGVDGWYERIVTMTPLDCARPHGAEYVGSVQLTGGTLPADDVLRSTSIDLCWTLAARFFGLTRERFNRRPDLLSIAWDGMDQQHWQTGDRYQRCFVLVSSGKKLTATLKDLGTGKLPV